MTLWLSLYIQRPPVQAVNLSKFASLILTQSKNSSAKIAIMVEDITIFKHESVNQQSLNWTVLPNFVFQILPMSFATTANNFFFHILDKTTRQLTDAGIIQRMLFNSFGPKYVKRTKTRPVVLKVNDLSFGFVIFLVSLAVSLAVFLCELMVKFCLTLSFRKKIGH